MGQTTTAVPAPKASSSCEGGYFEGDWCVSGLGERGAGRVRARVPAYNERGDASYKAEASIHSMS